KCGLRTSVHGLSFLAWPTAASKWSTTASTTTRVFGVIYAPKERDQTLTAWREEGNRTFGQVAGVCVIAQQTRAMRRATGRFLRRCCSERCRHGGRRLFVRRRGVRTD